MALRLRYLERMPLGTPYPEVVERVAEVTRARRAGGTVRSWWWTRRGWGGRWWICCGGRGRGARCRPVIDHGRGARRATTGGYYRVPKRDLIVGLQVLLQTGGLQIAEGMADGAALVKEMAEMRVKVSGAGGSNSGHGGRGRTTTWCSRWRWRAGA